MDDTQNVPDIIEEAPDALREAISRFKRHLENREWAELRALLPKGSVLIAGEMRTYDDLVDEARERLQNAADVELSLRRVLQSEVKETVAHIGFDARLIVAEAQTWEEQSVELKLFFGYELIAEDEWRISTLAIMPAVMESSAETSTDGTEASLPPEFVNAVLALERSIKLLPEAQALNICELICYVSEPLCRAICHHEPQLPDIDIETRAVQSAPAGMRTVYVPVFLPDEALRGLLGTARTRAGRHDR